MNSIRSRRAAGGPARPSDVTLYEWLNRAFEEKRLRREGSGTRSDPWRYRLENEDDAYRDRCEPPPLRELRGGLLSY